MVRRHPEHPPTFGRDNWRILVLVAPAGTLSVNLEREIKELPEQPPGHLLVITLISGTFSELKSTASGSASKDSLSIFFLVSLPQSL